MEQTTEGLQTKHQSNQNNDHDGLILLPLALAEDLDDAERRPSPAPQSADAPPMLVSVVSLEKAEDEPVGTTTDSNEDNQTIMELVRHHSLVIDHLRDQPQTIGQKLERLTDSRRFLPPHPDQLRALRRQQKRSSNRRQPRQQRRASSIAMPVVRQLVIDPWYGCFATVGDHFSRTDLASFYALLRWTYWVNMMICLILCFTLLVPEFREEDDVSRLPPSNPNKDQSRMRVTIHIVAIDRAEQQKQLTGQFDCHSERGEERLDDQLMLSDEHNHLLPIGYVFACSCLYLVAYFVLKQLSRLVRKDREQEAGRLTFSWLIFSGKEYPC